MKYNLKTPRKNCREYLDVLLKKSNFYDPKKYMNILSKKYKKSLKIIGEPDNKCNCFCYVFETRKANKFSVVELIQRKLLIMISDSQRQKDDIALYFDEKDQKPKHVGRLKSKNRIVSKWNLGPVLEHSIMMLPLSFGNQVHFYRIVDRIQIVSYLDNYSTN